MIPKAEVAIPKMVLTVLSVDAAAAACEAPAAPAAAVPIAKHIVLQSHSKV